MPKILFVGDPHVQVSNLEESARLMDFVLATGYSLGSKHLIISGDLFHTHAVIRMEVLSFWKKYVALFSSTFPKVWLIVGNHDMAGDKQKEHKMSALDSFKGLYPNVEVIDCPRLSDDGLAFMPYYSDNEKFINDAKLIWNSKLKKLFCHQTFDGSTYDNGFYAPEGVDQNLLPDFEEIVAGHIHTEQRIGRVFYPGTPKWDTLSDANQEKGIWFFSEGIGWVKYLTKDVCSPIYKFSIKEGENIPTHNSNARIVLELEGSSRWIKKICSKISDNVKIIAKPTDSLTKVIKKRVNTDILEHISEFKGITCNPEDLKTFLKEKVLNE